MRPNEVYTVIYSQSIGDRVSTNEVHFKTRGVAELYYAQLMLHPAIGTIGLYDDEGSMVERHGLPVAYDLMPYRSTGLPVTPRVAHG